jgi:hypothetical protein
VGGGVVAVCEEHKRTDCEEREISGVSFEWIMVEIKDVIVWGDDGASNGRKEVGRMERSCPYDVIRCTVQM